VDLCGVGNYAELATRLLILSPYWSKSPDIIFGLTRLSQHRQEFVGSSKAAWRDHGRGHDRERLQLRGRTGAQVDFRALKAGMAEPKGDLPDILRRLERVDRTGMTQNMRCHSFGRDRRLLLCSRGGVLAQNVFESGSGHGVASGVQEQCRITAFLTNCDP
jgi:hypothetical protein